MARREKQDGRKERKAARIPPLVRTHTAAMLHFGCPMCASSFWHVLSLPFFLCSPFARRTIRDRVIYFATESRRDIPRYVSKLSIRRSLASVDIFLYNSFRFAMFFLELYIILFLIIIIEVPSLRRQLITITV